MAIPVVLGVLILALAGLVLWAAGRSVDPVKAARDAVTGYQSGHPRHRFDASRAVRWDPFGDHNAAVAAMDPEDRAYPLLAEVHGRLLALRSEWGDGMAMLPEFLDADPSEPGWDDLLAWLADERILAVRAIGRAAAAKPALGMPLWTNDEPEWHAIVTRQGVVLGPIDPPPQHPMLVGVLLPVFGPIANLSTISDAAARVGAQQGDTAAFESAVGDMFDLAAISTEPGFLINQLFRNARLNAAVERIGRTLAEHPGLIDDAVAVRLERRLADAVAGGWTAFDAAVEMLFVEDAFRRTVDDRGVFNRAMARHTLRIIEEWDDGTAPAPSTAPLDAFNPELLASYHEMARHFAAREDTLRIPWRPYAITRDEIDAWVNKTDSLPGRTGRRLVDQFTAEWFDPSAAMRAAHQNILGLRVALAAHRHRLRHGEPPSSLDAIDTDLIGFDPVDGFTGGRLVYRWTGEGHLVYALGADGDDDAGRHVLDPDGAPLPFISDEYLVERWDGDFVVFPPRE